MESPQILIKKGGFLSALASGLFGFLMVTVAGATALGLYGMHIADNRAGALVPQLGNALKEWRTVLPIADSLNDHRAPEYRESLRVSGRIVDGAAQGGAFILIDIANTGTETVSLLSLRVTIENEQQVPVHELQLTAATPIAAKCEWIGPLLPATKNGTADSRRIARHISETPGKDWTVRVEVTDIRVTAPLPKTAP